MPRSSRRTTFLFAVVLTAVALIMFVQASAVAQTLEEKVKSFQLKNGMTWLVVERHEAPVAFCAVGVNVGAANEWPNVTGISHLIEHMMFKGSEMMGTKDYKKELPYIQKTDELGDKTIELRKELGEWRFAQFQAFSKQVLESFTKEEKDRVGASKFEQNKLVVDKIRAMQKLPDSLATVQYLVTDQGVNYLDKYIEYLLAWGDISKLLDGERQYIVKDELWG
ncbi:MAG TPA: insulinase family protein, partial [Candidatus Bathyarchaeia archaeon]|nr:insulinase family protein [Candidatus Bathyarchaeia archaeon]